jgi:hypothetical protein
MNPRLTTGLIGLITVILGVAALFYPDFIREKAVGFAVHQAFTENFVNGEVRAVYGGLFLVVGVYTVMAAMDPYAQRARILLIGLLWLGLGGGRLFGVFADGGPGLRGWLYLVFELGVGGVLVAISQMAPPAAGEGASWRQEEAAPAEVSPD